LILPQALVLDLDGTLIDSAADLASAVNMLLREFRRPEVSLDAVRSMIGDGLGVLALRALSATGEPPSPRDLPGITKRLLQHYINPSRPARTQVYPGVVETLQQLKKRGVRLGLCTNKAQEATELVLTKTGLSAFFDCVVGQDFAPKPKPDPAHVRAVLTGLDSPQIAVMVGDSGNDLAAGRGAGLPVVLVTYGYSTKGPLAAADATIDRFADLPDALGRVLG